MLIAPVRPVVRVLFLPGLRPPLPSPLPPLMVPTRLIATNPVISSKERYVIKHVTDRQEYVNLTMFQITHCQTLTKHHFLFNDIALLTAPPSQLRNSIGISSSSITFAGGLFWTMMTALLIAWLIYLSTIKFIVFNTLEIVFNGRGYPISYFLL